MSTQTPSLNQQLAHNWHPASQMFDYTLLPPLMIKSAQGSYIELNNGQKIIDAISSWWCKNLGHQHPKLQAALIKQAHQFEHVIFANTTHETILKLSEKLSSLTSTLKKVFYASDGSSAIEIAMKMSVHARVNQGQLKKKSFIALSNGYHGETAAALSVSDIGIYKDPYQSLLFPVTLIQNIPYVDSVKDPLWNNCDTVWKQVERSLEPYTENTTAIILEPIVQGAGGMKIYSADFLKKIRAWTKKHDIHLIADEIMTGFARTGKMLASQYADIEPDFLCLSKGLTAGWLPFSATLTRNDIYDLFYDNYSKNKSFLHSHTYSGNALAASIALEVINIYENENMCLAANQLGKLMLNEMRLIARETNQLTNIRQIGAIVAADLITDHSSRRLGFEIFQQAVKLGAFLRPIGNTIYWLPPLNTTSKTIDELSAITKQSIVNVMSS